MVPNVNLYPSSLLMNWYMIQPPSNGPSILPAEVHNENVLIFALRTSLAPSETNTCNEVAIIIIHIPNNTCDSESDHISLAMYKVNSEMTKTTLPYFNIWIGPMESIHRPTGKAIKIGNNDLKVTNRPMLTVEAPSSCAYKVKNACAILIIVKNMPP